MLLFISANIPVCCQVLRVSSVRKALFVRCSLQYVCYYLFQQTYQYVVKFYVCTLRLCEEGAVCQLLITICMLLFISANIPVCCQVLYVSSQALCCQLLITTCMLLFISANIPVCCQVLRVSSVRKALFVGCSLQMVQQLAGINTVM